MNPKVEHLFVKSAKGQPMLASSKVEALAGFGLEGDAAYGRRSRHVLLIDMETLAEFDLNPGDVRENITTVGLDLTSVTSGTRLQVGPALLEVTGPCAPCSQLDDLRPGLQQAIEGRRGMLARVLEGGTIEVGASIKSPVADVRVTS